MGKQFDLRLPMPEDYSGALQRSVRMNNQILETVREQNDIFCTYIAEVRWLLLQLTRKGFAKAAKVDQTAVRSMETTGSVPTNSTLHRVYTYLRNIESRFSEYDLSEDFLDIAVRERYGSSRRMHAPDSPASPEESSSPSTTQIYHRWAIMKSLSQVEAACGVQRSGIWQREATGVLPEFAEMSRVRKNLRLPPQELALARKSWMNDRNSQLLGRDIPPALADFLTRLEAKGLPTFSAASIRHVVGCTCEHAALLQSGQMVPFDSIANMARELYEDDDLLNFAEEWEAQYAEEKELPRLGPEFMRIRDEIGVTNRQLSLAMDIKAPEHRSGAKKKSSRIETFRPSHLIRETLETTANSLLAPAGVLVGTLAHAASVHETKVADPTASLRQVYNDHRSRLLRRSGASIHSNPLRLARDYWGLAREDLARTLKVPVEDIAAYEQNGELPKRILDALERLGEEKLQSAKQRWTELIQPPEPTTVQNLLVHLQRKAGSFQALESLLCSNKCDSKRGVSGEGLAAIVDGSVVPSWPMLQRLCAQSGLLEFPREDEKPAPKERRNTHEKLWRDWAVKYSDALHAQGKTEILSRCLHHLYGEHAESLYDFMPSMPVTYPTQTRIMQKLEAGDTVPWTQIARTLDAAGLDITSVQYVFIKELHETRSVPAAILRAEKAARTTKKFEHESFRFALTTKERKRFELQIS